VVIGTVRHMGTAVLQPSDRRIPTEVVQGEQGRARKVVDAVAADLTGAVPWPAMRHKPSSSAQALMAQDTELMAEVERRAAAGSRGQPRRARGRR
jgi:phosphotransferase system enzyme I (PtsI)